MHFCMSAMAAIIPNSSANKNMCLPNKSICGCIIELFVGDYKIKGYAFVLRGNETLRFYIYVYVVGCKYFFF